MANAGTDMAAIAPIGGVLGVLGGGQLGRMIALAAAKLGLDVHVFAPEPDCPAGRVAAKTWTAAYDDADALAAFAKTCDVVTFEFENIPIEALEIVEAAGAPVRPGKASLENSQDRLVEKTFLNSIGLATAPFVQIDKADDIAAAIGEYGDGFLKLRRSGYDGKGQVRLGPGSDYAAAWDALGGAPAIFEQTVPFIREVSAVVARSLDGAMNTYDIPENTHGDGVLHRSVVPAGLSEARATEARDAGERLADALNHVGVLALELFETKSGALIANEFAPRVHNTGHWTEEACITGQFEQHTRAVCGWPLASSRRLCDADMRNLLGDDVFNAQNFSKSTYKTNIYGKRGSVPGRKMGHLTHLKPT